MTPEPAAAAPPVPAAETPAADTSAAQIAELREQIAEANRTAQYWADKARTPAAAGAPATDPTDVLEEITTGGVEGFDKLAAKRGFIKRDEVESLIATRAASLTEEQQLIQEYPDLKKKDSEFFKATALNYSKLVKDGVPQHVAMGTAARATELEFLRSGKMKLPGAAASAQTPAEKESARLARVAAQSGEGSGRRPAAAEEDDGELDATQLRIVRSMLVGQPGGDGKPMTEEQAIEKYKARAQSGVSMKGR
jgi:hypothetical protein